MKKIYNIRNKDIDSMINIFNTIGNVSIGLETFNKNDKFVAIFTHELTFTGAPIVLKDVIKILKQKKYVPIIFSPKNGPILKEMMDLGCIIIVYKDIANNNIIDNYLDLFSFAIVNTSSYFCIEIINKLNGLDIPVFWWIHEGCDIIYASGNFKLLPNYLMDNIHIYCAGEYSQRILNKFRPNYNVQILQISIPNSSIENEKCFDKNHIVFSIIGTLTPRKGQLIVLKAIENMNPNLLNKCSFLFAGTLNESEEILNEIKKFEKKYPNNIKYLGELMKNEITDLYMKTDCLICSSVDEPGPIVVVEAWQHNVLTICSSNCGQAKYAKENNCALVYENNDPIELAKLIEKFASDEISNKNEYIQNAYNVYKNNFSEDIFAKNLNNIINELNNKNNFHYDELISIIIPTFNGEGDLEKLLRILSIQEKINFEIICVDSGSTDKSIEIIKKYNCKLIQIDHEKFSHSYARNLGVENSNGDLILFMTQDALPNNTLWLYNFIKNFVTSNVDAATIKMNYKDESDLYGKFETWSQMHWIKLDKLNQIVNLDENDTFDSLRQKAVLTDITCLCKKDIFLKYKYRGTFGEDVDFAMRILKSGYKIGLFKNISVDHSHNRSQFYYFKRGFVDTCFVNSLTKSYSNMKQQYGNENIDNCILSLYMFFIIFINKMKEISDIFYDIQYYTNLIEQYVNCTNYQISKLTKEEKYLLFTKKEDFIDNNIYQLILQIFLEKSNSYNYEPQYVDELIYSLRNNLKTFLEYNPQIIKQLSVDEFSNFILKKMSLLIGSHIAAHNKTDFSISLALKNKIKELSEKTDI